MKNNYKVVIAGVSFNLTSEDDEKYVTETVEELNKKITDIQMRSASCTKLEAVILCALECLDEKKKLEAQKGI